ncbi:MAG TPA: hypothetical protein VNS63_08735 [Blastocatellia bacterium]|nr:hypothetical protein [Blastocatellia bacterium]
MSDIPFVGYWNYRSLFRIQHSRSDGGVNPAAIVASFYAVRLG